MRAAVIKDATVINIIEVPSLDILPNLVPAEIGGAIGDMWDGVDFKPKENHGRADN